MIWKNIIQLIIIKIISITFKKLELQKQNNFKNLILLIKLSQNKIVIITNQITNNNKLL